MMESGGIRYKVCRWLDFWIDKQEDGLGQLVDTSIDKKRGRGVEKENQAFMNIEQLERYLSSYNQISCLQRFPHIKFQSRTYRLIGLEIDQLKPDHTDRLTERLSYG